MKSEDQTHESDEADGISDEELAEAEAAVTLALLPEGARMPAHVRDRIEERAGALLGQRAKEHALKRADNREREEARLAAAGQVSPIRSVQSTTSAGTQVISPRVEDARSPVRTRREALFTWSGWTMAAAAAIALFVSRSTTRAPASGGGDAGFAWPSVQRLALSGAGELEYDRARGTGKLSVTAMPAFDAQRERLQLWVMFEGDETPRPLVLMTGAVTIFGEGNPICQRDPRTTSSAPGCVAIRNVVVTREAKGGSLAFSEAGVILRAGHFP